MPKLQQPPQPQMDSLPSNDDLIADVVHKTTLRDLTGAVARAAQAIEDAVNMSDITDDERDVMIADALRVIEETEMPLAEKVEQCAHMRRSRLADIESIKTEEKRLRARRERLEAETDHWDSYVMGCLQTARKVRTPLVSVTLCERAHVEIDDESALPSPRANPELWHPAKQIPPSPDKLAIGKALKAGADIPGARLETSQSLRWS